MRLVDLIAPKVAHERSPDDIAVKEVAEKFSDRVGTPEAVAEITREHGVEIATAALYHYFRNHRDKAFNADIESLPASRFTATRKIKLLIVPGLFYEEHPELGGDGSLVAEVAARNGFEVERIRTRSRGSIQRNILLLEKHLSQESHPEVWLVSFSRGSAEVRSYLQSTDRLPPNLRGWINVSGIVAGTALADDKLSSPLKRLWYRMLCACARIDYTLLEELCSRHALWQKDLHLPAAFHVIHVAGFPLAGHVHARLYGKHRILSKTGPNDGVTSLSDFLGFPGSVYPVWGGDHFSRFSNVSSYVYRLCWYIQKLEKGNHHEKDRNTDRLPAGDSVTDLV